MIILGNRDKSRLVRSHRYVYYQILGNKKKITGWCCRYSSGRHKRRPSSKKKHHNHQTYSSEESHSFEEDSSERPGSKPKRHQNRHKHRPTPSSFYEEDNNVQPFIPLQNFPDVKWQPMSSQELFGNFPQPSTYQNHFRMFPGGYQRGAIHYSQPVPLEITTPYAMPSNHFVSYESTPLNTQTFSTKDAYKPFDYSILEKTEKPVKETKTVTPFSIIVEGSTEKVNKTTVRGTRNKGKRVRGSGKFEFGQKENKP